MNLVMLGAPGAGKGTQGKLLSEKYHLKKISTGDLIRRAVKEQTQLGKKFGELIHKGLFIPDELSTAIVVEEIKHHLGQKDVHKGFLLDGFPRTETQGRMLGAFLNENGMKLDLAIFLDVPEAALYERLKGRRTCNVCGASYHAKFAPPKHDSICDYCGNKLEERKDDTDEVIKKRMEVYKSLTYPVVQFYQSKNRILEIKGDKGIAENFKEIDKKLQQIMKQKEEEQKEQDQKDLQK